MAEAIVYKVRFLFVVLVRISRDINYKTDKILNTHLS